MDEQQQPHVAFFVNFKAGIPADEIKRRYHERMPEFRDVPGLIQKYYVYDEAADEWGGFYLWDSQQSLDAFLDSDLRKSIPAP